MYKYQKDIHIFGKITQFFFTVITLVFLVISFNITNVSAQSAESVSFTTTPDKTSISSNDNYSLTYKVANLSDSQTIYNANISFNFLDKLSGLTFSNSSTGQSLDSLKSSGYTISSLNPLKNVTIIISFKSSDSITTGQKVKNTLDNSNQITTTVNFRFSNDTSTPEFSKDSTIDLPDVTAPKPEIAKLSYPAGITGTDLSKLDANSAKSVSGFFLQGINKITFNETIDLTSSDAVNFIKNLPLNIDLNSIGSIKIASSSIFNKKASVEMNRLSFIDTPQLFLEDKKYTKTVTFDNKNKTAKFDIDGVGTYSLIGEVKTTIPENISNKNITITGVLTDPSARVETEIDGTKMPSFAADLGTGDFSLSYSFKEFGTKNIIFTVYSRNNIANKQTFTTNYTGQEVTPTVAVTTSVPKEDKFYFSLFFNIVLAILGIGIIAGIALAVYSLRKKQIKAGLLNSPSNLSIDTDEPLQIQDLKVQKQKDLNNGLDVSENRHEIIRAKVEHNLNQKIEETNSDSVEIPDPNKNNS